MSRSPDEIFHEARNLPPEQREPYLKGACAGDEALRAKVETLLRADAEAGSFMAADGGPDAAPPTDTDMDANVRSPSQERPGGTIGATSSCSRSDARAEGGAALL